MNLRKLAVIGLSALLVVTAGCGADKPAAPASSGTEPSQAGGSPAVSEALSSSASEPGSSSGAASEKAASESISSGRIVSKPESGKPQDDNGWVAYDTNKDTYKLHIKRKDGTGDKVIVNDIVLAPCVAGEWVYYIYPLQEIDKVKLDGSEKTKVCSVDAMEALNANAAVTAEYKDGYILYKLVQLREVGDNRPHTVTYYKLDLEENKITEAKG